VFRRSVVAHIKSEDNGVDKAGSGRACGVRSLSENKVIKSTTRIGGKACKWANKATHFALLRFPEYPLNEREIIEVEYPGRVPGVRIQIRLNHLIFSLAVARTPVRYY
jgi:hypothetical protein